MHQPLGNLRMKKIIILCLILCVNIYCQESPNVSVTIVDSLFNVAWEEKDISFNMSFPGIQELKQSDKVISNRNRLFFGDSYVFQVLCIPIEKNKFNNPDDTLIKYIDSETKFLGNQMGVKDLYSYIDKIQLKTDNGESRVIYFWGFKHPETTSIDDTTNSNTIQTRAKQSIFAITLHNNYLIGLSTTVFDENSYETLKNYIIENLYYTKYK